VYVLKNFTSLMLAHLLDKIGVIFGVKVGAFFETQCSN